jgi:hypothetical protein
LAQKRRRGRRTPKKYAHSSGCRDAIGQTRMILIYDTESICQITEGALELRAALKGRPEMNIGEEICGEWLRHIEGCDFVQYNTKTTEGQGEIDVIGIKLGKQGEGTVYACEVAVHLVTGLQYVKNNQPDNVPRLTEKFRKDIEYIQRAFPDYQHVFMFWSPVVKDAREGSKRNQLNDIDCVVETVKKEWEEKIKIIINENFMQAIEDLRNFALGETKEMDSSVVRFLQVEEHLKKHLKRKN